MGKLLCNFCGQRVKSNREFCPNCGNRMPTGPTADPLFTEGLPYDESGAFSPPGTDWPPEPAAPPPGAGYRPVPDPTLRGGGHPGAVSAVVVFLILVLLGLAGLTFWGRTYGGADAGREEAGEAAAARDATPYAQIMAAVEEHLEQGNPDRAVDALSGLVREGCDDPDVYRRGAELLLEYGDNAGALRMYLLAYGVTGEQGFLDLAAQAAGPDEVVERESLREAMEFLFGRPMAEVTWADVGRIKSYVHTADSCSLGLLPRDGAGGKAWEESLYTFSLENDTVSTLNMYYLYGLTDLRLEVAFGSPERTGFPAMRDLRSLYVASLSGEADLTGLWGLGSLEELSVGGSAVVSLSGLERLPAVHALELRRTGLESLEELASCPQLRSLSLERNSALTSVRGLEALPHLEALSIERGELEDLHLLGNLSGLRSLAVTNTDIKEVSTLFGLEELRHLELAGNSNLLSVGGISQLQNLESLILSCSKLRGTEEIAGLTGLRVLTLHSPATLSMVAGLASLEELAVTGPSSLDSLAPLAGLGNLRAFSMSASGRTASSQYSLSLSPLAGLGLERLEIVNLSIYSDCSAIFSMGGCAI